jgi:hypothetical protein
MNYLEGRDMTKKDKIQLTIIYGLLFVLLLATWIAYSIWVNTPVAHAASEEQTSGFYETDRCPAGSYEIGERDGQAICKLEPTGCPYGDSIPLDSPKCAPPEDPATAYAPWNPSETSTGTNTQQSTQTPTSTPKTTNNDSFSGGGASTTYDVEPIADNVTPIESKSFETADNAEKTQENAKNVEKSSNYTLPIVGASFGVVAALGYAFYRYRHMV